MAKNMVVEILFQYIADERTYMIRYQDSMAYILTCYPTHVDFLTIRS